MGKKQGSSRGKIKVVLPISGLCLGLALGYFITRSTYQGYLDEAIHNYCELDGLSRQVISEYEKQISEMSTKVVNFSHNYQFNRQYLRQIGAGDSPDGGISIDDEIASLSRSSLLAKSDAEQPVSLEDLKQNLLFIYRISLSKEEINQNMTLAASMMYSRAATDLKTPENIDSIANGTLISDKGHILTNMHVPLDYRSNTLNKLVAVDIDGNGYEIGGVLGYSPNRDLAILKSGELEGKMPTPIYPVSQEELSEGMEVEVIGIMVKDFKPFSFECCSSSGKLSGLPDGTIHISKPGIVNIDPLAISNGGSYGYSGSLAVTNGKSLGVISMGMFTRDVPESETTYVTPIWHAQGLVSHCISELEAQRQVGQTPAQNHLTRE